MRRTNRKGIISPPVFFDGHEALRRPHSSEAASRSDTFPGHGEFRIVIFTLRGSTWLSIPGSKTLIYGTFQDSNPYTSELKLSTHHRKWASQHLGTLIFSLTDNKSHDPLKKKETWTTDSSPQRFLLAVEKRGFEFEVQI